jgi:hypothetical protein
MTAGQKVLEVLRAVLPAVVDGVGASLAADPAETREAAISVLEELRSAPPRKVQVDADALDAAFERGRAAAEAVVARGRETEEG